MAHVPDAALGIDGGSARPRQLDPEGAGMRKLTAVLWAAAILLAAGCATQTTPSQHPVDGPAMPAAPSPATFSHELATPGQRHAAFQHAWRIVNDRFYDPKFNGVDWDAVHKRYLAE